MQYLTLEQFRATVDAGGVLSVTLRAQGPSFAVQAETRRGEAVLVDTRRKSPRLFIDPRKALKLLRELGIRRAGVDAEQWRPDEADLLRPTRPDSKVRMQAANELASIMAQRVQSALDNYQANPASASDAMAFFDELDQKIETVS